MDFADLQTTLTIVIILAAVAVVVSFDYRRKEHKSQRGMKTPSPQRPARSTRIFDAAPLDYAPAKKVAAERPSETLVAITTISPPPAQPRIERETFTVEMAPSSPTAPSSSTVQDPPVHSAPTPAASTVTLPPVSLSPVTLPPVTIDGELWERLIASQSTQTLLSPATPRALNPDDTVEATRHMIHDDGRDLAPATHCRGMIKQPALEQLLERQEPFTGLVVFIGINDSDSSLWHGQGLMQSVGNYIATLLGENDFACRTGYDEFVMVCPGALGAQSQRRLNRISERLWDYQLRDIGASSILFSWAGVQVQDQPLAEAVASATERMRETKQRSHSGKPVLAYREASNSVL